MLGRKKRERPDMVLQTAVPRPAVEPTSDNVTNEQADDNQTNDRRRYVPPIFTNGIPKGMLPNNNPAKVTPGTPTHTDEEEEIESAIQGINYNMLFMLASGIGLGVLLCYKGYKFITPAMKAAAAAVEETTNIVDE